MKGTGKTAMMKANVLKVMMIVSGALLVLALVGMSIAVSKPVHIQQETNLVNYTQKSQFDFTTYLKPSYLYGPVPTTPVAAAQYPQEVVGNIAFTYTFQPTAAKTSGTAWVEAVLENPGIWQKKLMLVTNTATNGNYTLNFALDVLQINQLFDSIENETGLLSSTHRVTINAYFQSGSVLSMQSLPITLQNNLVSIPNSLNLIQDAGSGLFAYTITPATPVTAPAPDVNYPSAVIDSISFTYTYVPTTPTASTSSVQIIMENQGTWQKKVSIVPQVSNTGNVSMNFSISPDQLQQQFDDIDKETGLTTSPRLVTVQALVNADKNTFTQNLPLTFKDGVLTVGGALQQQQSGGTGKFDYTINLKANSIYDSSTLKPTAPPVTTSPPSFDLSGKPVVVTPVTPAVLKPGQTAFINLIDSMTVNFGYQFTADKPVNNLKTTVDITAVVEAPQSWSKSFPLLSTSKSGNIAVNFPVDISSYSQLMSSIRTETGVSSDSYNLTITAAIHTTGTSTFGPIDETSSPIMKGTIKNNVLTWDKDLTTSKAGAIKQTVTVKNSDKIIGLSISTGQTLFVALSCIFVVLLIGFTILYFMHREPAPSDYDRKVRKINKTYGTRIAESNANSSAESETSVSMNSMGDLMKIADELGKPVVHQSAGAVWKVQSYYVIDGNTRYQYSIPNDKAEQDVRDEEEHKP